MFPLAAALAVMAGPVATEVVLPSQPAPRRADVPPVSRIDQLSGTRKIAASGGMVRLSSGVVPSEARTSPILPTLLPP